MMLLGSFECFCLLRSSLTFHRKTYRLSRPRLSIVPQSRFLGGSLTSGSAGINKKNEMTMYFDDVSREGTAKTLKKEAILQQLVATPSSSSSSESSSSLAKSSIGAPPATIKEKTTTTPTTTTLPKETSSSTFKIKKISESEINNSHDVVIKKDEEETPLLTKEEILLKRLRLGYNAQTARSLSPAEGEFLKSKIRYCHCLLQHHFNRFFFSLRITPVSPTMNSRTPVASNLIILQSLNRRKCGLHGRVSWQAKFPGATSSMMTCWERQWPRPRRRRMVLMVTAAAAARRRIRIRLPLPPWLPFGKPSWT
jgi:hypothetical protein